MKVDVSPGCWSRIEGRGEEEEDDGGSINRGLDGRADGSRSSEVQMATPRMLLDDRYRSVQAVTRAITRCRRYLVKAARQ